MTERNNEQISIAFLVAPKYMLYHAKSICSNAGQSHEKESLEGCLEFCHNSNYTWIFYSDNDKKCGCCIDPIEETYASNYNVYQLQKGNFDFCTTPKYRLL